MPTNAIQKVIDSLLKQADIAVTWQQWNTVRVLAEEVLKLDRNNSDALSFRTTATRMLTNPALANGKLNTANSVIVIPEENSLEPPPDPDDAIYFSISGSNFVGAHVMQSRALGLFQLSQNYPTTEAFGQFNLPDHIRIWGWRCSLCSTGGTISVSLKKTIYIPGNIAIYTVGQQRTATNGNVSELNETGLNEVVDNNKSTYHLAANVVLDETEMTPNLRLNMAIIICQPVS